MLTLLQFPPQDPNGEIVTVIEVGPSTNACPQNLCKFLYCKLTMF